MDQRAIGVRAGLWVEWLTVAWMAIEAAISIGAGLAAGSIALIAFGMDSVIELVTAATLIWRLRLEGLGRVAASAQVEVAERHASQIVGWSLMALAVYVVGQAAYNLWTRAAAQPSPAGIAVAVAGLIIMPALIRTKLRVASEMNSPALKGHAACGVVCVYMAATVLVGLALQAAFGWWWADPVAALGIVYFIVREAREALAVRPCGCGT